MIALIAFAYFSITAFLNSRFQSHDDNCHGNEPVCAGNGHSNHLGNSIIGSMEINGVLYQGVLFAQPATANVIE